MTPVSPNGATCKLFDVSHWDTNINWDVVAKQGFVGCFLKVTEGTKILDTTYQGFDSQCDRIGLKHGAYHFFHPAQNAVAQAQFFVKSLGNSNPDMLVMDWETTDGTMAKTDVNAGLTFISTVQALSKKKVIVYGSPYFLQAVTSPILRPNPLWIAEYGAKAPLVPPPWVNWNFWQYSDKELVQGIGACDVNLFNGDASDFTNFLGGL